MGSICAGYYGKLLHDKGHSRQVKTKSTVPGSGTGKEKAIWEH